MLKKNDQQKTSQWKISPRRTEKKRHYCGQQLQQKILNFNAETAWIYRLNDFILNAGA